MPDSGGLRGVEASQRPDSQVRVFAMPPRDNAGPDEIMQGFLEALTSDDPEFEIARKYLTKNASRNWHPQLSTTVLADGPNVVHIPDRSGYGGDDGRGYALKGDTLASVDKQHAYQPAGGSYNESVHLSLQTVAGHREWRIDLPPSGIVLGVSDFQRIFRPVDKYYYSAASGSGTTDRAAAHGGAPGVLVADPVYVRQRVDPVTQTVRALLAGPTRWLAPAVQTSFPAGVRLGANVKGMAPDDQNRLKVPLNGKADRVGQAQCKRMAAQIIFTLQDLTSTGITEVTLLRSDGSLLCELDRTGALALSTSAGRVDYQYFIDSEHRLERLPSTGSDDEPERVPGPLGSGAKAVAKVAVSHDEKRAAGVSTDGRRLYVTAVSAHAELGDPVVTSHAASADNRLTAPSWDGQGNLWVADRDPKHPRLLLLDDATGDPVTVSTPRLKGRITAVRVAADGVRIALLVNENGKDCLYVGRIQRPHDAGGTGGRGTGGRDDGRSAAGEADGQGVTIADLRPGAPQMEQVSAMSWAGGSRLVVVGRESGGVQQVRYVQCDGSAPASGVLPGLTGVEEIAATDDDRLPLVALSDDGIVRMQVGAQWQTVGKGGTGGTSPVYPG
jgi:hypothetical protein